jgi:V/A-type H+-transporting ATPase subunit D
LALKFQYNKTFLQQLNKELKVRVNALPTLQAKESALRLEVKKAKREAGKIKDELDKKRETLSPTIRLWAEFPEGLIYISDVKIRVRKIAGVKTPVLEGVEFKEREFSMFSLPAWLVHGIDILKNVVSLEISRELALKKVEILEYARKKTTQKVNLYEKVQIPE